jgi:DNA mismatch endonuclease (patch repair protein)
VGLGKFFRNEFGQRGVQRSSIVELMFLVRNRGNSDTELVLVRLFRQHKISGWRRHVALFGKPDFAFRKRRLAVFVDGCFWHGCPKHARQPKSNRAFWRQKLSANKTRDLLVNRELRKRGWLVVRIWECALQKRPLSCLQKILHYLT